MSDTPTEERIHRLENRVDKMEDSVAKNLQRIFEELQELRVSSVGPSKELEYLLTAHNSTMLRVERFEIRLLDYERAAMAEARKTEREFAKLESQKAWLLGVWSVVAFLAAILGALLPVALNYLLRK
jgi:chromosome segregation ATPase